MHALIQMNSLSKHTLIDQIRLDQIRLNTYQNDQSCISSLISPSFSLFQELPVHQRADAVSSLVYEANARMRDPVYGCVGAISYLQNQVSQLQMQLAVAQAEILCIQMQQENPLENQQMPMEPDDKSFIMHNNLASLPQFINFPSSSNVSQEPLKRESLWT